MRDGARAAAALRRWRRALAAALGALTRVELQAAMIAGMDTRPAAPAMPLRTVRRETGSTRMGSAMVCLLLRCCPTKSDRISRIVPTCNLRCQGLATYSARICWNTLTFCRLRGNLS